MIEAGLDEKSCFNRLCSFDFPEMASRCPNFCRDMIHSFLLGLVCSLLSHPPPLCIAAGQKDLAPMVPSNHGGTPMPGLRA